MRLTAEDIRMSFDKKEVLKGASFTFEQGKIYALLGRNGAGKTTFFNCLNEDLKMDSGSFFLFSFDQALNVFRKASISSCRADALPWIISGLPPPRPPMPVLMSLDALRRSTVRLPMM